VNVLRAAVVASLAALGACAVEVEPSPADGGEAIEAAPASIAQITPHARGVLGGYEQGRIWGWAQLLDDDTPVRVRIEVDGQPLVTLLADEPRLDLVEKGLHPTGRAGFSAVIGELAIDSDVEAVVEQTGSILTNSPCRVQGYGPVSSCTEGTARGALHFRDGVVHGWAQIIGREAPVTVRLEVDGVPIASIVADRHRPDLLAQRLHPTGTAGFHLPLDLEEGEEVAAYVAERGEPLMGSPLVASRSRVGSAPKR
jgi:hypothetical protein